LLIGSSLGRLSGTTGFPWRTPADGWSWRMSPAGAPATPVSPVDPLPLPVPLAPPPPIVPMAGTSAIGSGSQTGHGEHPDTDLTTLASYGAAVLIQALPRIAPGAADHAVGCVYDARGHPD
jgi:hypothetical protein